MNDLIARHLASWQSFRSLPFWVQVWVAGILVPVNAAGFLLLDTLAGQWTALAAVLVLLSNYPVMLACRGMGRLLSVPHLLIWGPLQVALLYRLASGSPEPVEFGFMILVLVVNGISLVFDTMDTLRWLRGEREVPGHG